jgi:hypothetical protein
MRSRNIKSAELVAILCMIAPAPAIAHEVGLSYGVYRTEAGAVKGSITFSEKELVELAPKIDRDQDHVISGAEIESSAEPIGAALLPLLVVKSQGARCTGAADHAERVESDAIRIDLRWSCPKGVDLVEVELAFFDRVAAGHRHLVQAKSAGSAIELVARRELATFRFAAAAGSAQAPQPSVEIGGFFLLGIEHILSGIDHLLFLLGLILIGGKPRALVGVITAFTIAHSITLGLAVLGIWAPSGSVVEPVIALSVAYVAVENWFIEDASRRWRISFAFGLIHGFGFAGALGALAVPPSEVPLALLLFNLGVETGQLGVLALILPPILLARRSEQFRVLGVRAISAGIAVVGLYWFVSRVYQAVA